MGRRSPAGGRRRRHGELPEDSRRDRLYGSLNHRTGDRQGTRPAEGRDRPGRNSLDEPEKEVGGGLMPKLHLTVPHTLGKEQAGERLKAYFERFKERHPDQFSDLTETWLEDRVEFSFSTFGLKIKGVVA